MRRIRVSPDVRRQIVETVFEGQSSGAAAARLLNVSEATVHRILKAERLNSLDPMTVTRKGAPKEIPEKAVQIQPPQRAQRALSVDQEQEVIDRFFSGSDMAVDLAREFGIHKSTISRILKAAQAQVSDRPIAAFDPIERNRRVAEGIARAAAAGSRNGRKPTLSKETQEMIVSDAAAPEATYSSVAVRYNVSPTTISRVVRAFRVRTFAIYPQSLDEIITQILMPKP